ncbi:hypothetical protein Tco_0977310 [Tanacetum coccineum]|uniref:Uncharacterized protein n=1 Tax=Tanacetum coccineum TaxID=301880 RepID=A0ABQ5EJR4_9ASTR
MSGTMMKSHIHHLLHKNNSTKTKQQQTPQTVSTIKLPFSKRRGIRIWAMKIEHYLAPYRLSNLGRLSKLGMVLYQSTLDTTGQHYKFCLTIHCREGILQPDMRDSKGLLSNARDSWKILKTLKNKGIRSRGYITGKGKIQTGKLDFEDVSFVKELQHFNLFSVSQMCDKMNKVQKSTNFHAGQQASNQNEVQKTKLIQGNSSIEDELLMTVLKFLIGIVFFHKQLFFQNQTKRDRSPREHTNFGTASANEGLSSLTQPIRKKNDYDILPLEDINEDATVGILYYHASYDGEERFSEDLGSESWVDECRRMVQFEDSISLFIASTPIENQKPFVKDEEASSVLVLENLHSTWNLTQTVIMLEQILTGNPHRRFGPISWSEDSFTMAMQKANHCSYFLQQKLNMLLLQVAVGKKEGTSSESLLNAPFTLPSPEPSEATNGQLMNNLSAQSSEVPLSKIPDHFTKSFNLTSPKPFPTPNIPDSFQKHTVENLGDHSFKDTSLSGKWKLNLKGQITKAQKKAHPVFKHFTAYQNEYITRNKELKETSLKEKGSMMYIMEKYDDQVRASEEIFKGLNNDKGRKFKQLENDEEFARKVQEEWEAEEEKNKIAEEEEANEALIKNFDDVKARIEADIILAERIFKSKKRELKKFEDIQALYKTFNEVYLNISFPWKSAKDERFIKQLNKKRSGLSKSEVIKEDTKEEVKDEDKDEESTRKRKLGTRKKMKSRKRRYIQHTSEDDSDKENDDLRLYLTIAQDEDKEVDYEILDRKYPIIDWKTECFGTKPQPDEAKSIEEINLNVVTRSNGQQRHFTVLTSVLSIFDREDLNAVYQLVMNKYQDEMPEGFERVLWGDLMVLFNPE